MDPDGDPDRHQNLITSSLGHALPLQEISSKSVHNFFSLDKQKDKQTDRAYFIVQLINKCAVVKSNCAVVKRDLCSCKRQPTKQYFTAELMPNTDRRRRRDETILSRRRRRCEHEFATSWRQFRREHTRRQS